MPRDVLVGRPAGNDRVVSLAKESHAAELLDAHQTRAQAVVDVVVVVGNLVHEIHELRFEGRALAGRVLGGSMGVALALVLDDPLAHLPGEVQAGEPRVPLLQHLEDAQGLAVVLESPVVAHQLVHRALARMAERRVAEVVAQHEGFRELLVESEDARHGAADLCAFEAVGEASAVVVAFVVHEDLGLVLEPPERRAVDDAVAVALEAGAERVLLLRIAPAAGEAAAHPVRSEGLLFPLLLSPPIDELHRASGERRFLH